MKAHTKCPFCDQTKEETVLSNDLAYVRLDKYPVNKGHSLIIPIRHIASIFEASTQELKALWAMVDQGKALLERKYSPNGFNIGINDGKAAGQSITHLHIHLIPRYLGDVQEPLGGVRGVIPGMQKY